MKTNLFYLIDKNKYFAENDLTTFVQQKSLISYNNVLTRCFTYSTIAFKAESVNFTCTTLFELECVPGFREEPPSPRRPSVSPLKLLLPNSFIFDIEDVLFNVVESNPNL